MTALLIALVLQDPAARVAELAPGLEAKEVARVYRAVERLAELGEPAAALLEARAKDAPEPARPYYLLAADEARRSSTLPDGGRARRFTITYAPQDLGTLLTDFRRRTGARFSIGPLAGAELPDVGVELKEASFGEALHAIARAAKMIPLQESEQFYFEPSPAELPTFTYAGYLLQLRGYNQRKIVDFRRPARCRLKLGLDVFCDPAFRVVAKGPAEVTACVDDQGRKLAPLVREARKPDDERFAEDEEFLGESSMPIDLEAPAGGIAQVACLRGFIRVKIARASAVLAIDRPAAGSAARKDGFELIMKETDPEQARLNLELASPGRKPAEFRDLPVQVTAFDKSGEQMTSHLEIDRSSDVLKIAVYCEPYQDAPAPAPQRPLLKISRIEVSVAVDCLDRRVPFEFRDLKIR